MSGALAASRRWLFADQLGPHFLDGPGQSALLIESRAAFARRPVHRRRAHLVLSALRHRAAESGGQVTLVQAHTYRDGLEQAARRARGRGGELSVCAPTSRAAGRFVRALPQVTVLPAPAGSAPAERSSAPGLAPGAATGSCWRTSTATPRRRLGILMDGPDPAGGRWNFDAENREPPDARTWPARPAALR